MRALALSLALAGAASALDLAACLNSEAAALASLAACGHAGSIEYCLANRLPTASALCTAEVLAQCFVNAGCQPDEALIEAAWTIKRCEAAADAGSLDELRRRKPRAAAAETTDTDTETAKTTKTSKTTAKATAETTTSTTTSDETTTTSSTSSSSSSTSNSRRTDSTDSTYSASTTSLVCLTTTTVSTSVCPVQSTGANAGKTTLSCYSTIALFPTCAAGLMCEVDSLGTTNCLRKQNAPGTAGIIISIVFASAIVVTVATMCFFCCRERRQHARSAKAAEAAAIARQAAVDRKRPTAAARAVSSGSSGAGGGVDAQPLMASQPQYLPPSSAGSGLPGSETTGDLATGPNPFADQHQLR